MNKTFRAARYATGLKKRANTYRVQEYNNLLNAYNESIVELGKARAKEVEAQKAWYTFSPKDPDSDDETEEAIEAFNAARKEFFDARAEATILGASIRELREIVLREVGRNAFVPDDYIEFLEQRLSEFYPVIEKHVGHIAIFLQIEGWVILGYIKDLGNRYDIGVHPERGFELAFHTKQYDNKPYDIDTSDWWHNKRHDREFREGMGFSDELINHLEDSFEDIILRIKSKES